MIRATVPRPRVLMVVQRLLPFLAGAEIQALGLASALSDAGIEVSLLATRYAAGLEARATVRGQPVRRLPVLRGPLLRPSQLASTALYVTARGHRFDVVHGHGISPACLGAVLGARAAGLPAVIKATLGGPDGEIARIRSARARPLRPILHLVSSFAALTPGIAAELEDAGIPPSRIAHVDNGIDLGTFRPASPEERASFRARYGLPPGPLVLFAAQLIERKGISQTLTAWSLARDACPAAWLVIAGAGPLEPSVRAAVADPDARVRYLGFVDDVAGLMGACDVFVAPSRNESFGNSMIEALACGLPLVAGRTGIAARIPIEPAAGRLVDVFDPPGIARALRDVLGWVGTDMGLAARARALVAPFAFESVASRYIELYRDLTVGGRQWSAAGMTRLT